MKILNTQNLLDNSDGPVNQCIDCSCAQTGFECLPLLLVWMKERLLEFMVNRPRLSSAILNQVKEAVRTYMHAMPTE